MVYTRALSPISQLLSQDQIIEALHRGGVLAHSMHLRGSGVMENGVEKPNVRVTLASKILPEDCARLNLGYLDPLKVNPEEWKNRESEGILYVLKAGEILFKVKS